MIQKAQRGGEARQTERKPEQQAKERKTALEVSEWYHEELKKRKEYKERWIKEYMREASAKATQQS